MADFVTIKPKPVSTSEIADILSKDHERERQKLMTDIRTRTSLKNTSGSSSMIRACKLFIKIDDEGLLTDGVSVSDVVNFDCYESIVKCATEILAGVNKAKPDQIEIDKLFYYKKRARSTRLNPVRIFSTTDVFRALAEHPSGEVPIGVRWSTTSSVNILRNAKKSEQSIQRILSPKVQQHNLEGCINVGASSGSGMHTFPTTTMLAPLDSAVPNATTREHQQAVMPEFKPVTTAAPLMKPQLEPAWAPGYLRLQQEKVGDGVSPKLAVPIEKIYFSNVETSWPETAVVEVVITYDGTVERKKLNPAVSRIMNSLIKGDYSCITKDYQDLLNVGSSHNKGKQEVKEVKVDTGQPAGTDNGINSFLPSSSPLDNKRWKDFDELSTAKLAVYELLSSLKLNTAKFRRLLTWMRSLRLGSGSKGKYVLTHRSVLGTTKVRDSEPSGAPTGATDKWKNSGVSEPTVSDDISGVSNSVFYNTKIPGMTAPQLPIAPRPPQLSMAPVSNQQPVFLVMPNKSMQQIPMPSYMTDTGNSTADNTGGLGAPDGNMQHIVGSEDIQLNRYSAGTVQNQTTSSSSSRRKRKKSRKEIQQIRSETSTPSPVPVKCYRASNNFDSRESSPFNDLSEMETETAIKQEPDYEFETVANGSGRGRYSHRILNRGHEGSRSPGGGIYSNIAEMDTGTFTGSDDHSMSDRDAGNEDPFRVVVKTEPLDDYE